MTLCSIDARLIMLLYNGWLNVSRSSSYVSSVLTLSVLLRFELFFDGTFGDWNLPPVSIELKEGVKPYHGRPYFILHKHKAVLMKEIKRLCNI